jgi:Baculovirus F protein
MLRLLILLTCIPATPAGDIIPSSDPQKLVIFQGAGKVIHTRGYAHLRFQIDLAKPTEQLQLFASALRAAANNSDYIFDHQYGLQTTIVDKLQLQTAMVDKYITRLQDLSRMDDADFLHTLRDHYRDERSVLGILQFGVGVFMGIYNQKQLSDLRNQIMNVQTQQTAIIKEVDSHRQLLSKHSQHIAYLQHYLDDTANRTALLEARFHSWTLTSALMATAQSHVDDITAAVEAAMAQRASILLAPLATVADALADLDSTARGLGYELLVTKPADVFQCKASYMVVPGGFEIFVHVPMAKTEDEFNLYRFLPIPVPLTANSTLLVLPQHDLLAITADETKFTTMPSAALASCHNTGAHFLCPDANTYQMTGKGERASYSEDACLFELFHRDMVGVKRACRMQIGPPEDGVFAVDQNQFVFTSREPHKGFISCADGATGSFNAGPATLVKLDPGCTAKSQTHAATAQKDISQSVPSIVSQWPIDPAVLLGAYHVDRITAFQAQAGQAAFIPSDIGEAAAWITEQEQQQVTTTTTHVHTGLIVAMLLTILATAAAAFGIWRNRTALQRRLLAGHRARHLKEQAARTFAYLQDIGNHLLPTTTAPPTEVPWNRQAAKREIRAAQMARTGRAGPFFLGGTSSGRGGSLPDLEANAATEATTSGSRSPKKY